MTSPLWRGPLVRAICMTWRRRAACGVMSCAPPTTSAPRRGSRMCGVPAQSDRTDVSARALSERAARERGAGREAHEAASSATAVIAQSTFSLIAATTAHCTTTLSLQAVRCVSARGARGARCPQSLLPAESVCTGAALVPAGGEDPARRCATARRSSAPRRAANSAAAPRPTPRPPRCRHIAAPRSLPLP